MFLRWNSSQLRQEGMCGCERAGQAAPQEVQAPVTKRCSPVCLAACSRGRRLAHAGSLADAVTEHSTEQGGLPRWSGQAAGPTHPASIWPRPPNNRAKEYISWSAPLSVIFRKGPCRRGECIKRLTVGV